MCEFNAEMLFMKKTQSKGNSGDFETASSSSLSPVLMKYQMHLVSFS